MKIKISRPCKAAILFGGAQKFNTIQASHARTKFMQTHTHKYKRNLLRKINLVRCARFSFCFLALENWKTSKQTMRERNSCTHTHMHTYKKNLLCKIKLSRSYKVAILFGGARKSKSIQAGHSITKFCAHTLTSKTCIVPTGFIPEREFIYFLVQVLAPLGHSIASPLGL